MDFDWKINGNQYQATREGYNLLDFNVTQNGSVTYNKEDGTVTINGQGGFTLNFTKTILQANKKYKVKIELVSGTIKDSSGNDMLDNSIMINTKWLSQKYYIILINEKDTQIAGCWLNGTAIFNNARIKIWAYEGTEDKPYEQYGVSPSPGYRSEIETVSGSVEIDVVNKNLFPSVKSQSVESNGITLSYNADTQEFHAEGTTTSTKFFCIIRLEELKFLQQNKNYVFSITKQMISNTSIQLTKYGVLANSNIDTGQTSEAITQLDIAKPDAIMLYSNDAIVGTKIDYTFKVQIEEGITATNIVEHQSQTAIMPVQQEMLTGDYISSVEHHEWGKLVLDGENYGCFYMFPNGRFSIANPTTGELAGKDCKKIENWAVAEPQNICCTHLYVVSVADQSQRNMLGITNGVTEEIIIKLDNATEETNTWTSETINAYLKQQYEAGTPVTVYYKLAKPLDLELTSEQKAVRNQKLYTYKNITNISLSDELASIDVTYKKDLETMFNNIIKQIPSTTSDTAET